MKYITGDDRNQIVFLPDCIEDYVSEDNPKYLFTRNISIKKCYLHI